jgi:prepilin-type N-terminal cleavage/methylation domain-containing protein
VLGKYNKERIFMKLYRRGFTLLEILISIAIIGVLTAIGTVSYTSINRNARDAKRRADVEQIRSALELYRADNGTYPAINTSGFDDTANLSSALTSYIASIPVGPKHDVYEYEASSCVDTTTGPCYGYYLASTTENAMTGNCDSSVSLPTGYTYCMKNP